MLFGGSAFNCLRSSQDEILPLLPGAGIRTRLR